jgi:hypothetical protein
MSAYSGTITTVYWVYLVPMVLRKHTLYNIKYISFE